MNNLQLTINSAAGKHLVPRGEQELCLPIDIPKGVAKIITKFLKNEDTDRLLRVSKGWSEAVLEERAYCKLLTRLIRGFESLFEEHLRNNPIYDNAFIAKYYTRFFQELRAQTIQKNFKFFNLEELALMNGFWEDYLQIRRIEYTFCDAVMKESRNSYKSFCRNKHNSWDETTCNMVEPYLKALISEFKLEKFQDVILLKFSPLIAQALRRDGSIEWLVKLRTINAFVTTETGKKLSTMESEWHSDFRDLRKKK